MNKIQRQWNIMMIMLLFTFYLMLFDHDIPAAAGIVSFGVASGLGIWIKRK